MLHPRVLQGTGGLTSTNQDFMNPSLSPNRFDHHDEEELATSKMLSAVRYLLLMQGQLTLWTANKKTLLTK